MSTIHLQVAPRVGPIVPRGSRLAAAAFLAAWRSLARVGQGVSPQSRHSQRDVQAVRDLAESYRDSDPDFAGDLLAAADRHERLHG